MSPRRKNDKKDKKKGKGRKEPRKFFKKKPCKFCKAKIKFIDYKDVDRLRNFLTDRGKIVARRMSGNCAKHQRQVTTGIKLMRNLGLLPFTL